MLDMIIDGLIYAECDLDGQECVECGESEAVVETIAAVDGGDETLVGAVYCESCW